MNKNIEEVVKDALNQTWYVRRKNEVMGPFSGRLISRRLLLGQVLLDDELSLDQFHWQPAAELTALIPDVMKGDVDDPMNNEQMVLARRWADERSSGNRRKTEAYDTPEKDGLRTTTDRRNVENNSEIDYRERRDQRLEASRKTKQHLQEQYKRRQRIQGITIVLLVIGAVVASFIYAPVPEVDEVTNCMAQPEPEVVWTNCQLVGISHPQSNLSGADIRNANLSNSNLSGSILLNADLSYSNLSHVDFRAADLRHANLKGANLQQANLQETNFNAADLSYADLTGATLHSTHFANAILGKTIWVDGRECGVASVGVCR